MKTFILLLCLLALPVLAVEVVYQNPSAAQIIAVGGLTNGEQHVSFSGYTTFTNIYYTNATTVSGTSGTDRFTTTNNGFAGLIPGDFIVVNTSDQYTISYVDSGTLLHTMQPLLATYTSTQAIIYPHLQTGKDFNGLVGYTLGAGGDINVTPAAYGIALLGEHGTNSWMWANSPAVGVANGDLVLYHHPTGLAQFPDVIHFNRQNGNNYYALQMAASGVVGFGYGITNMLSSTISVNTDLSMRAAIFPAADLTQALGASSARWTNVYTSVLTTSFSNALPPAAITFPNTTVPWTNTFGFNIEVYIDNTGVTGTVLKKNGTTIKGTALPLSYTLGLQPNEYFSETYTVNTPTATWSPR